MSVERMIQAAIARADLWICALARVIPAVLTGAVAGYFMIRRWRK